MTDINKYAAESVQEYPEITEEWRQLRMRGFIEQAYRFGLQDGSKALRDERAADPAPAEGAPLDICPVTSPLTDDEIRDGPRDIVVAYLQWRIRQLEAPEAAPAPAECPVTPQELRDYASQLDLGGQPAWLSPEVREWTRKIRALADYLEKR